MKQTVLLAERGYDALDRLLLTHGVKTLFLVCDGSFRFLKIREAVDTLEERLGIWVVRFDRFTPNPDWISVVKAAAAFREAQTDWILAVGGGSAIDVAKCVRLFGRSALSPGEIPHPVGSGAHLIAMPTTAGTGSEATRFAVVYLDGVKQSVTDDACIPDFVLFDPGAPASLPLHQKKATMLDALCHATESFWSVHSTEESEAYAWQAVRLILLHRDGYLAGTEEGCTGMLRAANLAGKAINITQTTAGHAMCYKLTTLFGIAHGHAAALCDRVLFPWLAARTDRLTAAHPEASLRQRLSELAAAYGCTTPAEAAARFVRFVDELDLPAPKAAPEDIPLLCGSVNIERLRNFPVPLAKEEIEAMYREILGIG